jgi:hypothetical protein
MIGKLVRRREQTENGLGSSGTTGRGCRCSGRYVAFSFSRQKEVDRRTGEVHSPV